MIGMGATKNEISRLRETGNHPDRRAVSHLPVKRTLDRLVAWALCHAGSRRSGTSADPGQDQAPARDAQRFSKDGYHRSTMRKRAGADYEIELPVTVTPNGAVVRLEHALSNMEAERLSYRNRLSDAERRLASYRSRLGEVFAFGAELALKRDELDDIERDLAATEGSEEGERAGRVTAQRSSLTAARSASLMRSCQPGPSAWK
jgi:hypothetical protein